MPASQKYAIDPELAEGLRAIPQVESADIAAVRARLAQMKHLLPPADTSGLVITDRSIPGPAGAPDVPVRIYQPEGHTSPAGILDVHPGGFIVGDLDASHALNAEIAREVGAVVVSVDYRLAPENPFPAGLEDCYAALAWFAEHVADFGVDPARIALHGASAGGGLCAALALLARDRGGPALAFQYLGIPELDDRLTTRSMNEFVDTPMWDRPAATRSWDAYLGPGVRGTDAVSSYAAPARSTGLGGLPPAYVSVMEFDPLRDEGLAYAQGLLAAGVSVELHLFPGTFHGSSVVAHAEVSRREQAERIAVLRRALRA